MAAVQEICDRTALATGKGIGDLASKRFGKFGRYVLFALLAVLIVANTLNIAADLVAVGSGMQLLHLGPTWLWALIAGVAITAILVFDSFDRLASILKILCAGLFSYLIVAVIVTHEWTTVLERTIVPHLSFSKGYIGLLVAILGTTISPYLFFWQSAHRLEDMKSEKEGGRKIVTLQQRVRSRAQLKERTSRMDVFSGMAFSNVVMFSIIVTASETLHVHHKTNIQSAAEAAQALKPLAGQFASAIFALGFIGSGLLAIPILAASGSIGLSDLLGKEWGFSSSVRKAPLFYSLVAVGTIGGTALSLLNINPFQLLIFVAVVNGVTAAPFLVIVMLVSGNKKLMGDFANGKLSSVLGWLTVAVMTSAAVLLFATS